jgi:2-oxoglutarate dehydrogenase E1 component
VFTPKAMLRLRDAASPVEDFITGSFREVIDEPRQLDKNAVQRLIVTAGKPFHDLQAEIAKTGETRVAVVRLEQFYQDRRSYLDGNGCGADLPRSEFFEFSCQPAPDGQSFLLLATGVASGVMAGFTYTLDQQGNAQTSMLPAAWGDAPLACWINRRGASC